MSPDIFWRLYLKIVPDFCVIIPLNGGFCLFPPAFRNNSLQGKLKCAQLAGQAAIHGCAHMSHNTCVISVKWPSGRLERQQYCKNDWSVCWGDGLIATSEPSPTTNMSQSVK